MNILRAIYGSSYQYGVWISDSEILEFLETMAPKTMLVLVRLMLFVRIVTQPSVKLLVIVANAANHRRSWLKSVWEDLSWLSHVSDTLDKFAHWHWTDWVQNVRSELRKFKRMFKSVVDESKFRSGNV